MSSLRLLTLNALFKGDVTARLRALDPLLSTYDIVCLQEVMYRRNLSLFRSFAHRKASGAALLKGGLVMLSRKPFSGYQMRVFDLRKPARPEWLMRKGFQLSIVDTPASPLAIVNTHLSANRDDDWSPGNRYTQVAKAELDELAEILKPIDLPLVVTGDFNLPRGSSVLADFLTATGLQDAMAGDARPTYRPTSSWPSPPAFDHVLTRSGLSLALTASADLVLQEEVTLADGRSAFVSDHVGVAATLSFQPS